MPEHDQNTAYTQYVNCPHCHNKVSHEHDECPECGKPIYDYDVTFNEKDYDDHYSDYLQTNKSTRPIYKFLSTASVIAIVFGLYLLFFVYREEEGPAENYYLVYGSMIIFAVTQVLIWVDSRKPI